MYELDNGHLSPLTCTSHLLSLPRVKRFSNLSFQEKTMTTKLVTLDVTNTVIRVAGSVGQHYATVGNMYGIHKPPDELNKAFKVKWQEQNKEFPNYGASKGLTSFQWWSDLVKKCFIHCGENENNKTLNQISSHLYVYFNHPQAWELLPGAEGALKQLKNKKSLHVGAVSNFDDRLEGILTKMGVVHYFDFVLASQKLQCAKPDPKIFHAALQQVSVRPENAIHVGDSVINDYLGAKNVGIKSLLFVKDSSNVPDNVDKHDCISNLKDLLLLIKE